MSVNFTQRNALAPVRSGFSIESLAQKLRTAQFDGAPELYRCLLQIAGRMNALESALRDATSNVFEGEVAVVDAAGNLIGWIGLRPPYKGAWFKEVYIGGGSPLSSKIIADANGNVTIDGSVLVAGTVTAAAFNIAQVFVEGLTLTNNSPAAGRVAWSACTVRYNGVTYSISSGNTPLTTDTQIYWDAGNTTFTAGPSYAPQAGRFAIATNNGGTADTAWNKGAGTAAKSIQESNLVFGLLKGFAFQPVSAANVTIDTATVPNGTTAATTIMNVTEEGGLLSIAIYVNTAITAGGGGVGTSSVKIRLTIDGSTAQDLTIYNGAITFTTDALGVSQERTGTGSSVGDTFVMYIGFTYTISAKVEVVVSQDATLGNGFATGQVRCTTSRAKKVS